MHPALHVLLTVTVSAPFASSFGPGIVLYAIALTILIDAVDHGGFVLLSGSPLASETREYLRKREIRIGWSHYYANRKERIDFLAIHNSLSAGVLFVLSPVIAINHPYFFFVFLTGALFHLACDIMEDFALDRNQDYWVVGWQSFLSAILHRILKRR